MNYYIPVFIGSPKIGDTLFYVPNHLDKKDENAEKGVVTQIDSGHIWVKFKGPTGELTPIGNLFTRTSHEPQSGKGR